MCSRFSLLSLVALVVSARLPGNEIRVTYVDGMSTWWGAEMVAASIAMPGYAAKHSYNVINLAFLLHYGVADALSVWHNPFGFFEQGNNPFGTTKDAVLTKWREIYHAKGVKVMASAFGATEFPTSAGYDADSYCSTLAQFVLDHKLDGLDLDWEDNDAMNQGTGEQWLITCTRAIRRILPKGQYLLTHAPQAPYFVGRSVYPNGGYLTVHQEVGDLIDWYNVQFYNQGDTSYDSYEYLFERANGYFAGTSVKEMMAKGIPLEKIVVGKPVTRSDAVNTGWVSASDLHQWAQRAHDQFGWKTGLMDWQYSSDKSVSFLETYLNGLNINQEEV